MVALGVDEDLRLVLEPPERLGVEDPVAVSLEGSAPLIGLFRRLPASGCGGPRRRRGEVLGFAVLGVGAVAADQAAHTMRSLMRAETKSRVETTMAMASIWTAAAR